MRPPKNTDETASPTIPPTPKLLSTSNMHTASDASMMISLFSPLSCCFLFGLLFVLFRFFVDLAAILFPLEN